MSSHSDIVTDFDGTMIRENAAAKLVVHYLLHGREALYRRVLLVLPLLTPHSRREHFSRYYDCLRRIPVRERQEVLARIHPSQRWIEAVDGIRKGRAPVRVSILSRNCIDVIHDWVLQNKEYLARKRIRISSIIANRPLDEDEPSIIRERSDLTHIDYVGFGDLQEDAKRQFIGKKTVYIGDHEERVLKPLVGTFISV